MRVLIVDSDAGYAQSIELILKAEGFHPYVTDSGEEAVELAQLYDYDVVLLDPELTDMASADVIRALHAVPARVMALSKNPNLEFKLSCFQQGADDFLPKFHHKDELLARMRAITRQPLVRNHVMIRVGTILINTASKTVAVEGVEAGLVMTEYKALLMLAQNKGALIPKESLFIHLYGADEPYRPLKLNVVMTRLRKKLSAAGAPPSIETLHAEGYVLQDSS